MGRKKRPYYRMVVIDSRTPRDGRYIEAVGTYDPVHEPPQISIQEDRIHYWMDNGALPSFTVRSLLKKQGIMHKRSLIRRGLDEAQIQEELKKWEVLQIEKAKRAEARKAAKKKEKEKARAGEDIQEKAEEAAAKESGEKGQAEPAAETQAVEKPVEEAAPAEESAKEAPADEAQAEAAAETQAGEKPGEEAASQDEVSAEKEKKQEDQ